MDAQEHWNRVYERKGPLELSWFEKVPETSLDLIEEAGMDRSAPVIDVGGGSSRLVGELLDLGYADLTVADISPAALALARAELGDRAEEVRWVEADARSHEFDREFQLWHDRAVFHFMVDPGDRDAYLANLRHSLPPGGQLIIATFGPEAPPTCSGLPVHRYGADELAALLPDFELASERRPIHLTPAGREQAFVYARFVRS